MDSKRSEPSGLPCFKSRCYNSWCKYGWLSVIENYNEVYCFVLNKGKIIVGLNFVNNK